MLSQAAPCSAVALSTRRVWLSPLLYGRRVLVTHWGFWGSDRGCPVTTAPALQGPTYRRWVLSWAKFVLTGEFCPPALSIHQLAAQGELSQLKEHLRKGTCLFLWVLTPDRAESCQVIACLWINPWLSFMAFVGFPGGTESRGGFTLPVYNVLSVFVQGRTW